MLDYDNAASGGDIKFERVGDVLTIQLPREGFVRGAGNQLRSWHFWLFIVVMCLFMNWFQLFLWVRSGFHTTIFAGGLHPDVLPRLLLQPSVMICMYLVIVGHFSATLRLGPSELVRSVRGLFSTTRETRFERSTIIGVHVGWLTVTLLRTGRNWFGGRRRVHLFTGRTRAERARVVAVIRNRLEPAPGSVVEE